MSHTGWRPVKDARSAPRQRAKLLDGTTGPCGKVVLAGVPTTAPVHTFLLDIVCTGDTTCVINGLRPIGLRK